MTAFRRFGPEDVVDSVLTLHPEYSVSSGTGGWVGGPAGSASISVYGGARRSHVTFGSQDVSPSQGSSFSYNRPSRALPLTSSIRLVSMVSSALDATSISNVRWGEEHWSVVGRLYSLYHDINTEYTTSSYDLYCLWFDPASSNVVYNAIQLIMSSTFTLESRIKPFATKSLSGDFVVVSRNRSFQFGISGSTGLMFFSSSEGKFTSSFGPQSNRWSHVAIRCDGSSGTFTVDLKDAGSFPHSSSFPVSPSYTASFTVGGRWAGDLAHSTQETQSGSGSIGSTFSGFIGETRTWNVCRTQAQLSSSFRSYISGSDSSSLPPGMSLYYRFNDGPLATNFGFTFGSSSFDYINSPPSVGVGILRSFDDRVGPVWHPSDDRNFVVPKQFARVDGSPVGRMTVIDVPSLFYGRQIATGSVELTCQAFSSAGLIRKIVDDGRGGLYISGSAFSSSLDDKESYQGVAWNKVGNVFYSEGLIVIRDPSLLDFGGVNVPNLRSHDSVNTFQMKFRGVSSIPTKTLMCRIDPGEMNCTTNQTFYVTGSDGLRERRHGSGSVWITSVVIRDELMEPVMVVRLAQPIRHREQDRLNIKVKKDF